MNVPNLITIGRILIVPLTVWLIVSGEFFMAFVAFIIAGVSDAVDGYIAKHFNQRTELGAYLDPVADKLLLVSIYVTLGLLEAISAWVVIVVVSRDIMIIGAVMLSWLMDKPIGMQPLMVSKVNTVGQIALAGVALGTLGFALDAHGIIAMMEYVIGALTVISCAAYMRNWIYHMANGQTRSHH